MVLGIFAIIAIGLVVLSVLEIRNQGNFEQKVDKLKTETGCNVFCKIDPLGMSSDSLI